MVGAHALELHGQLRDLELEVVDQLEAGVDVAAPRVGDREAVEQLAPGAAEEVADGTRVAEGDQRRVDAVLERRAVPHQMQAKARQLALTADRRIGQPDGRHQVALGEHREHPRIDLVGLAGKRRQPFDLLRVGDQHLPAVLFERVVHEARPVHRLDHSPHPTTGKTAGKTAQPVGVRRHRGLADQLATLVKQTDVKPTSTQIQSSVQHERWASSSSLLNNTPSVPPRRPSFIAVLCDSGRPESVRYSSAAECGSPRSSFAS